MSQKTITVGTLGTPADMDTNMSNAQDNFTELYSDLRTLWEKHINLVVSQSPGSVVTIESVVSYTVVFSFGGGFYLNGKDNFKAVPAISSLSLANTKCCCLDITDLDAITFTAPLSIQNVKDDKTKIIAFMNVHGQLYSPVPSLQKMIIDAEAAAIEAASVVSHQEVTVASSGGDYATISDAIAGITDASAVKQYYVRVTGGTYNETGPNGNGLELKDYVHIIGAGKDLVTIRGPEATAGSESEKSTIHRVANCSVEGVTLHAYKCKYCVHMDSRADRSVNFTLRDYRTNHFGGADGYNNDIGLGLTDNQVCNLENGDMLGNGIFFHSSFESRLANQSAQLNIKAVSGKTLHLQDFLEYSKHKVTIDGCYFETLLYKADRSWYDGNPADELFNQGYFNKALDISIVGSDIGRIEYFDSFTLDTILGGELMTLPGRIALASNTGAGSISVGQAVKLEEAASTPNTYPSTVLVRDNVSEWDGAGIWLGVALESIVTGANGAIQRSGTPDVLADATSTAIVYGDELEVNSSGSFVKRSSGALRAYALEALASGTDTIKARLVT